MTAFAQERPPQGPPGTVTLLRTDYDRLLDLSNRTGTTPDRAPLAAALGRADISVRIDGGMARATIALEGEVFHTGVVKVPLMASTTLLDARLASGPLPLLSDNNRLVGLIAGPSAFAATLEWAAPLTMTPGRGSFVLPVPSAGSITATIDIPGERTDVRVTPGLVLSRSSAGGRTTIQATLSPGTSAQVSWSSRDAVAAPVQRDVRFLSNVKTLITIGESEIRAASLIEVTVLQGEASRFDLRVPQGYEVVSVSGATLDASEPQPSGVTLTVLDPALRRHQFLLTLERAGSGGSFKLDTSFATMPAAQRESGEVALAGVGTLEIGAADNPGGIGAADHPQLKRVDVREVDPSLASAAGQSILAAYRYQRSAATPPTLSLDVTRFSDAAVLAAVAERAVVTTLVTTGGRALTEVTLWVRNRAQPYMKVSLPAGASILSSDVAGQPVKPADGQDGTRVPLLRPGFRPTQAYTVSFVYLHAGSPFLKKGDMRMTLPRMDLPVTIVEWEVFVPEMYRVDRFDGDVIPVELAVAAAHGTKGIHVAANAPHDGQGMVTEQIVNQDARETGQRNAAQANEPSVNVQNLQRRASGVLPVRIEVPRAGSSYRFVKPLVIDQEAALSFRYRRR
jgi:hypothetical protein